MAQLITLLTFVLLTMALGIKRGDELTPVHILLLGILVILTLNGLTQGSP